MNMILHMLHLFRALSCSLGTGKVNIGHKEIDLLKTLDAALDNPGGLRHRHQRQLLKQSASIGFESTAGRWMWEQCRDASGGVEQRHFNFQR